MDAGRPFLPNDSHGSLRCDQCVIKTAHDGAARRTLKREGRTRDNGVRLRSPYHLAIRSNISAYMAFANQGQFPEEPLRLVVDGLYGPCSGWFHVPCFAV